MLLLVGHRIQERPGGLRLEGAIRLELSENVVADVHHAGGILTVLRLLDGVDFVENRSDVLRGDEHLVQLDGQLLESSSLLDLDANRLESGLHIEAAIAGVVDGEARASLTSPAERVLANHTHGVAEQAETPTSQWVHEEDVRVVRRTVIRESVFVTVVEVDECGSTVKDGSDRLDLQLRHFGHDVLEEEVEDLRRLRSHFELLTNATKTNHAPTIVVVVLTDEAVLTRHLLVAGASETRDGFLHDGEVENATRLFGGDGVMLLAITVEVRVLEDRDAVVAVFAHCYSPVLFVVIGSKLVEFPDAAGVDAFLAFAVDGPSDLAEAQCVVAIFFIGSELPTAAELGALHLSCPDLPGVLAAGDGFTGNGVGHVGIDADDADIGDGLAGPDLRGVSFGDG